ncbi:amino acid ABC transporter permease [Alphaproteobacteria bacterium LSUCC0684]
MFDYNFHWRPVLKSLPDLLEAGLTTLQVASLAMLLGILIGLCLAVGRLKGNGLWYWLSTIWIELARNTPALFQLFFFGFGLGALGIHFSPYMIVLAGLSFNTAGYLGENFRGGFQAIPDTQLKAARSLGMNLWQAYTRILVPQVFRIVYYPMTNQFVWVVLMSSLGMLVGYRELTGETQFFASKTYRIFEYFAVTAVIYYLMVKIILGLSKLFASRYFRY